jgi:hypothetical protein
MTIRRLLVGLLTGAAAGALAGGAFADPPGRVGRVADTEGDVSMQAPGSSDWIWATRNYPVAPGESFWTGDDGRTRLEIGSADARVDSETELDVLDLDYGEMRLGLPQGSVDLRLWATPRGGVTLATPAGDVRLDQRGLYRIDVGAPQADGSYPPVEVTVFEGLAEAPSPEGPVRIYGAQAAVVYAGYDPQLQAAQDAGIDDWGRDLEARSAWRPTDLADAALTGLADLAGAGDYAQDPQYGRVWFPRAVPDDWAPYRYGHWSYVQPWGYTWIDDQPWGFAPFHYGRWAQINGRWGWIPGQSVAEPVYAPALVAFVGGVGWSLGGAEAIGWTPLAPDEVYRPRYQVSNDYLRRVNVTNVRATTITNITNITNVTTVINYRNAQATTVVRTAAFTGAQPVHRSVIPVTAEVIARAPPATAANRPPPPPAARPGSERPPGVNGAATRPSPSMANRPPAVLQATHAAITAPTAQAGRPPVIAGARVGPPPARPMGASAAPVMISPSQMRHPAPPSAALPVVRGPAPLSRSDAADAAAAARAAQQAQQAQAAAARDAQAARASAAQAAAEQAREAAQARAAEAQAQAQAQARAAQAQAAREAQQAAQARAAEAAAQQARDAEAQKAEVRSAPPLRAEPPRAEPPRAVPPRAEPPREPAEKPKAKPEPKPREEGPGARQP